MTNDFELKGKHSIIVWNAEERVLSYTERILHASEYIHETIESVLHRKGIFLCFDERVHFRSFS
jgi:hypothetical protein